ncbi:hypothetical protein D3C73_1249440 [compost metagenome]
MHFWLTEVPQNTQIGNAINSFQDLFDLFFLFFYVFEIFAKEFHYNTAFYPRNSFLYIIRNGLREVEANARETFQLLLHALNKLFFGLLAFPFFFWVNIYMKLHVVKAGGIGTIVGSASLRHYLFYFFKT